MLFLLLTLLDALVLIFLTQKLRHQLVRLLSSFIKDFLALLDDLTASLVLNRTANCKWSVTISVALKDIKLSIFDDVLKDLLIRGVPGR